MTDKPRAADPETTGPAPGGSAPDGRAEAQPAERVVIRDKRRIDPTGGGAPPAGSGETPDGGKQAAGARPAAGGQPAEETGQPAGAEPSAGGRSTSGGEPAGEVRPPAGGEAEPGAAEPPAPEAEESSSAATESALAADSAQDAEAAEAKAAATTGAEGPVVDEPSGPVDQPPTDLTGRASPLGAELEALRAELDERTRDLQRVSAEYANYRKRVDRDRGLVAEQTTGGVLAALLPVLDDLDRAREHGDLIGPFGTVAEQLTGAVGKLGLTAFGEKGDPFDPTRHEAVAHLTSADVTEPTCVDVMRRGYLLGDRLLRPALVAVADPE